MASLLGTGCPVGPDTQYTGLPAYPCWRPYTALPVCPPSNPYSHSLLAKCFVIMVYGSTVVATNFRACIPFVIRPLQRGDRGSVFDFSESCTPRARLYSCVRSKRFRESDVVGRGDHRFVLPSLAILTPIKKEKTLESTVTDIQSRRAW